jgi:RNA polymerase sigma-70 factor (ECF subfamily)
VALTEQSDLIQLSREGDMEAFRCLMEQHQQYAYQIAYRVVHSGEDARDIVQDAFVKVWQHLSHYKIKHSFTTWLFRIVVNTALDKVRQNKRYKHSTLTEGSGMQITDSEKNPETAYIRQETLMMIQKAMNRLPEKQRIVFILRDLQGLSIEEVAEILQCSHQNIKSHLFHARRAIRKMIINNEGES